MFSATDPTDDDNGPGTYGYPTSADFKPGAFDLDRACRSTRPAATCSSSSRSATSRRRSGRTFGAQLLDLYVRDPSQDRHVDRRAVPAAQLHDRARRRLEPAARGAGIRRRRSGSTPPATRSARRSSWPTTPPRRRRSISRLAQFGTVGRGWTFTVALTGQDGFSPDQARGVRRHAAGLRVRRLPAGRLEPDLLGRPGDGAQGDGHDHAGGRRPGDRARPDPRAGGAAGRDRAVVTWQHGEHAGRSRRSPAISTGPCCAPTGRSTSASRRALTAVEAAGAMVVICTARPARWMRPLAEATGHRGVAICANGGVVWDLHTEPCSRSSRSSPAIAGRGRRAAAGEPARRRVGGRALERVRRASRLRAEVADPARDDRDRDLRCW